MILTGKPITLPDFAHPPLIEVALGAQFYPMEAFQALHAGLFWAEFRDRFPKVEEHEPIPRIEETFGSRSAGRLSIQVGRMSRQTSTRVWFMNEADTELIQIQRDRFIHNWRRSGEATDENLAYPHYPYLRESFAENLAAFERFLSSERLDRPIYNQSELTYVNEIKVPHSEIMGAITMLAPLTRTFLPDPEDMALRLRYIIPDERGEPLGRLHVELKPAFRRTDNEEALLMTLTARGRPIGEGISGTLRFLDIAHIWIVRAFVDLTSETMHAAWGKRVSN